MNLFDCFKAIDERIAPTKDLSHFKTSNKLSSFEGSDKVELRALSRLLLNTWSAEYALRITPVVNDDSYLKSSLHWTFPQAYYSTYFSARAFLAVRGLSISHEDRVSRMIGEYVVRGYYPSGINYYAMGGVLPALRRIEVESEIGNFLTDTRKKRLRQIAKEVQNNPKTALRSSRTGEIIQRLSADQYAELSKQLGYTSFMDLMKRLRISSTDRDVERLAGTCVDVKGFHGQLERTVGYINTVHELYIAKGIGIDAYVEMVAGLPSYLRTAFVGERLNEIIYPALAVPDTLSKYEAALV